MENNEPPSWLKHYPDYCSLEIKVKPGSKKNQLLLDGNGGVLLCLQAPAKEGEANRQLIKYLAKLLRVKQKDITIQQGAVSRKKRLQIQAKPEEQEKIIKTITELNE
ncbi:MULTISPECIES: DUF167 domain-containing protein [Legionella]|uniref:DUF167 domain-containing protein n=1 Tax=Legionella TaxID=445 RepID=UPI000F8E3F98|nr:DUF167 domain-containing protein [Legionella septentrionalis]MCP0913955.1 DUF167 domain-containing protein [Legionella sp. 27cVA30]RUR00037.1 DUF167 domain-containing protein [Legionella septentrionalis]RUR10733.1 DUF167 domain-containing protein [Legionella septentrionalis]RUR16514.1 DUF167 domain-containing protein [Legionella septentrionalis]